MYDDVNKNKQTYQDLLESNEEIEYELREVQQLNNNLKVSIFNQKTEIDHMKSEVTQLRNSGCFCYENNYKIYIFWRFWPQKKFLWILAIH